MTQAVAVRSQGDDFQARMFWLCAPLLLVPESYVARVSFESGPRAFDDVTVEYVAGKGPQCHSACNIDPLSRGIGVQN
ncbi:MAG: hypothetical protein KGL35_19500 [Bradyrhizobium sp.]|nr:hypothetical protein [Betaproteobacteria bacterium]MDE2470868.1 hypothetical protein [Bradyrhizobium sp.]